MEEAGMEIKPIKNQYFKISIRISVALVFLTGACWSFEKLWKIIGG